MAGKAVAKANAAAKAAAAAAKAASKKAERKWTAKEKAQFERAARAQALQAMRENQSFRGFTSTQLHSTIIDSKSLYDCIFQAKLAVLMEKKDAPVIGFNFYKLLALTYRGDDTATDGSSSLKASQPDLVVSEKLIDALMAWGRIPKETGAIMEFLDLSEQALCVKFTPTILATS